MPAFSDEAIIMAQDVVGIMQRHSLLVSREIPIYQDFIHQVESGVSHEEAQHQLTLSLLRAAS
jgi:hypothetical protein